MTPTSWSKVSKTNVSGSKGNNVTSHRIGEKIERLDQREKRVPNTDVYGIADSIAVNADSE